VESNTELAKSIQNAMRAKHLTRDQLAETLGTNPFMIEKLLSGDVVPSTHLKNQLIKVLDIPLERIARLAERHNRQARGA
jgi:ribosome-binding protein aMBF1 (putative translation factor)